MAPSSIIIIIMEILKVVRSGYSEILAESESIKKLYWPSMYAQRLGKFLKNVLIKELFISIPTTKLDKIRRKPTESWTGLKKCKK